MRTPLLFILSFISLSLFAQPNLNLEIVANLQFGEQGNDIWGYVDDTGLEYAIMGTANTTRIFSLEDPSNPTERAVIPGSNTTWRDIKSSGNFLYVTADAVPDGLLIIDMSEAPETINYEYFTPDLVVDGSTYTLGACHNIYANGDGYIYLAGCSVGQGGVLIMDVQNDPWNPELVGYTNQDYAHDTYVQGDFLYNSEIYAGEFVIYDITDRTNPQRLGSHQTTMFFTHNAWASEDGNVLYTTDERGNAYVDSYDISDPNNPRRLDSFQPLETAGRGVIPHNTHVLDGFLWTSWYTDGVVIIDGNKPDNLIKVGAYDTFDGPDGGFSGCWGAYPYLPSGLLLTSDMQTGFYIFSPNIQRAAYLEGTVVDAETGAPITNANVEILSDQLAEANSNAAGEFKTGLATAGDYQIAASHPDYFDASINATLVNGEVTNVVIEMEKRPVVLFSGSVVKDENGDPISNASILLISENREVEVIADEAGSFAMEIVGGETFEGFAGAWGYNEAFISNIDPVETGVVEFRLKSGYKDDFVIDQGWIAGGNAVSGNWERGEPIGTYGQGGFAVAPEEDVQTDLGDKCWVTENADVGPFDADVDDGVTDFISQPMDLTGMMNPIIEFQYWFVNFGGFSDPDDALTVYLIDHNSGQESRVANIDEQSADWAPFFVQPASSLDDLSNFSIRFETSDLESGHVVEAAVDAFIVYEGTVSNANLVEDDFQIVPNPFYDQITIQHNSEELTSYLIRNIHGQTVKYGSIDNGIISTSELTSGMYFIQLNGENGITVAQRIVKH